MNLAKAIFSVSVLVVGFAACATDPAGHVAIKVDGTAVTIGAAGLFKSSAPATAGARSFINVIAFHPDKQTLFQVEMPSTPGSFSCAPDQAFVLYSPSAGNVWTAWTRDDSTVATCAGEWSQNGTRASGTLHAVVVPDPAAEHPAGTPASRTIDVTFDVGPDSHSVD